MKSISLSIVILLCTIASYAQSSGTSQEEYNYLTKGYQIQVENGMDMKEGYELEDIGEWSLNSDGEIRQCSFKCLLKKMRNGYEERKAILMIFTRTDVSNGSTYYFCIPHPDSSQEIWDQVQALIEWIDHRKMSEAIMYAMMKFSSYWYIGD